MSVKHPGGPPNPRPKPKPRPKRSIDFENELLEGMSFDNNMIKIRSRELEYKLKQEKSQRKEFFIQSIKQGMMNRDIVRAYKVSGLTYQNQFTINIWIRYYRDKIKRGEL